MRRKRYPGAFSATCMHSSSTAVALTRSQNMCLCNYCFCSACTSQTQTQPHSRNGADPDALIATSLMPKALETPHPHPQGSSHCSRSHGCGFAGSRDCPSVKTRAPEEANSDALDRPIVKTTIGISPPGTHIVPSRANHAARKYFARALPVFPLPRRTASLLCWSP